MKKKHWLRRFAVLECGICGEGVFRFFQLCRKNAICLQNIQKKQDTYTFQIRADEYVRARHLRYLSGVHLVILKKYGFPFVLRRLSARSAFCFGILLCSILWWALSGHIWEIRFTGNIKVTSESMLRFLAAEHVCAGMKKKETDTRKIADALRDAFPSFVWVAAETKGTVLYIRVEEVKETVTATVPSDDCSLYADREGQILSMVTRNGIAMKEAGAYVYPGDLLVSGEIPLYDDGQNITGYTYCGADADILIETSYSYYDRIDYAHLQPVYTESRFCGLQAGVTDTQLRLWQQPARGEIMATVFPLRLSENCPLPFSFTFYSVRDCRYREEMYTQDEAAALLQEHFSEFFVQLAKKVMRITTNNVKIALYNDHATASGRLTTAEYTGIQGPTPKTTRKDTTTDD